MREVGCNFPGGSGIRRISDNAVTDFPEPDSPTIPRVSPLVKIEGDAVDRAGYPLIRMEIGGKVSDFENFLRQMVLSPSSAEKVST